MQELSDAELDGLARQAQASGVPSSHSSQVSIEWLLVLALVVLAILIVYTR
jgi:hypothetical protein